MNRHIGDGNSVAMAAAARWPRFRGLLRQRQRAGRWRSEAADFGDGCSVLFGGRQRPASFRYVLKGRLISPCGYRFPRQTSGPRRNSCLPRNYSFLSDLHSLPVARVASSVHSPRRLFPRRFGRLARYGAGIWRRCCSAKSKTRRCFYEHAK
jgi:hypothetical protein